MSWNKCKSFSGSVTSGENLFQTLNTTNSTNFKVLGFSIITDAETKITLNDSSDVITMNIGNNTYVVNVENGVTGDGVMINRMVFETACNIVALNYFYTD